MLIGQDGEKRGLVHFKDALEKAQQSELDLVQVSPSGSDPIVCKLMDYGKHVFAKKKSISSSKAKVKRTSVKEIKFRPSTDIGDYNITKYGHKLTFENSGKTLVLERIQ